MGIRKKFSITYSDKKTYASLGTEADNSYCGRQCYHKKAIDIRNIIFLSSFVNLPSTVIR